MMNRPKWTLPVLDRVYRLLLKGYPGEFREKYGADMAQVFRDRCRDESRRRGTWGLVVLSLHTLADLVRTVPAEHFDQLGQDIRYGGRILLESPGFTTMAVLALALGIGANSAIFSAMTAALKPLPYKEPERLVVLNGPWARLSKAHFDKWRGRPIFSKAWPLLVGMVSTLLAEREPNTSSEHRFPVISLRCWELHQAWGELFLAQKIDQGPLARS
jgi:hypothetical protein